MLIHGRAALVSGGGCGLGEAVARELARQGAKVAVLDVNAAIPFPPRLGKPSEFAELAAHIVTNAHLNGMTIRLDGALRMAPRQMSALRGDFSACPAAA
jgi:NAD(P)-dependent dehydrogenase (short-subunit alcohol dehydrogenase family)